MDTPVFWDVLWRVSFYVVFSVGGFYLLVVRPTPKSTKRAMLMYAVGTVFALLAVCAYISDLIVYVGE